MVISKSKEGISLLDCLQMWEQQPVFVLNRWHDEITIVACNNVLYRLTGFTGPIECSQLFYEHNLSQRLFSMLNDQSKQENAEIQTKLKTSTGSILPVILDIVPLAINGVLPGANESESQWMAVCHMESGLAFSRKDLVELELARAMRLLTSIIEHIPTPLFIKNAADLSYFMFNKANEELTGFSNEKLIGKTDYDFFPTEQADFFTKVDREVLDSGNVYDIPEEYMTTVHGDVKCLHTVKVAVPNENGEPAFLLGICEDITEQRKAEAALKIAYESMESEVERRTEELKRANEQLQQEMREKLSVQSSLETAQKYLSHIVNKLPIALFSLNADGVCTLSEGLALKDLGYQAGELVGINILQLYESADNDSDAVIRALKGEQFTTTNQVGDLTLETHWVPNLEITPSGESKPLGCFGVSYNISEFKRSQDALVEIRDQLEVTVEQRTSELSLANKQLKSLDQMRRNMVSTLTHDLRTPLIAQHRVLTGLASDPDIRRSKKLSDLVGGFAQNNQGLLTMVNNLLETYELEDGRVHLSLEHIPISKVVSNCISELTPIATSKSIKIINAIPKNLMKITVDALLLKRLFNNLLGNALDNIPEGSTIRVLGVDCDDEQVIFIQDNGPGISQELLPQLFTRYFPGSVTRRKIGSGLGLYICKMIMDLHYGTIRLVNQDDLTQSFPLELKNSTSGQGAIFRLSFPKHRLNPSGSKND